jgi:hypothetical protein
MSEITITRKKWRDRLTSGFTPGFLKVSILLFLALSMSGSGTLVGRISGSTELDLGIGQTFPLPGVTVTLTHEEHDREKKLLTHEDGLYLFQNLTLGKYTVRVHKAGYRVRCKNEIKVRVNVDKTKIVLPPFKLVPEAVLDVNSPSGP